jgi:hypothetical protein
MVRSRGKKNPGQEDLTGAGICRRDRLKGYLVVNV